MFLFFIVSQSADTISILCDTGYHSKYDFKAKKRKRGKDAHTTSDDEDQELEESVRVISDLLQRAQKGDLNSVLELGDLIGVGGIEGSAGAELGGGGAGSGASGSGGGSVTTSSEAAEVRSRRLGNMKADMLAALAARARQGGKGATAAATGGATARVEEEDEEEDEEEIDELEDDVEEGGRARSRSVAGGSNGASGTAAGAEAAIDDAAAAGASRTDGESGEITSVGGKGSTTVGFALGMWDDDGDDSDAFPIPLRARKGKSGSVSTSAVGGGAGPSQANQPATTPPEANSREETSASSSEK